MIIVYVKKKIDKIFLVAQHLFESEQLVQGVTSSWFSFYLSPPSRRANLNYTSQPHKASSKIHSAYLHTHTVYLIKTEL